MYYKVSEFAHQTGLGLNSILIVNSKCLNFYKSLFSS